MLPHRSKRVALTEAPLPRLPLITGRELVMVAVALMVLLTLIFPSRRLFEELLERSVPDDLSMAYLENLLRSDRHNLDLRLLLANAQTERADYAAIEELLLPVELNGTPAQRRLAMQIRLRALIAAYHAGRRSLPSPDIDVLLHSLAAEERNTADLAFLAESALLLGRTELAWQLYQRLALQEPQRYREWVEPAAKISLGHGHYRLAADLYFLARQGAELATARRLYAAGVGALMANSRFGEAMHEADRHLAELADDADTLRFLVRSARAANDNPRAAGYARRLLGMGATLDDSTEPEEGAGT